MTEISASLFVRRDAASPIHASSAESGVNSVIKARRDPEHAFAARSGYFFATVFGNISPAKKTISVVTIVLRETAEMPHRLTTATVTSAEIERCARLVPISMVLIARSKLSIINKACFAAGSPRSEAALIFARDAEANAVSAKAK